MTEQEYSYGTGKRKCAVAQVRLYSGNGAVIINGKTLEEVYPSVVLRKRVLEPLQVTDTVGKFNVMVRVVGGGLSGQADAIRHGIARALVAEDGSFKAPLREHGLMTRDA